MKNEIVTKSSQHYFINKHTKETLRDPESYTVCEGIFTKVKLFLFLHLHSRCVLRSVHGHADAQPDQVYTGGEAALPQ